ncbi:MAG: 3-phosphoshikimate 1-carboxyvinyltransferase [Candidatus Marinimicrobia bacterium]|nr:3-phosphoshikimate 1-carboxyvinyltransferase [Candidatus Neomarinimicrobiota bacterium]MCF7828246.1 3-phosphoshikimate 1-carboxyvinyltransferase [Candidatus Neomarinimicrobiota bacterium]MCF7879579.1 3-phosphoshikimate 1-carboxyvinyltransferase [Candidatus Neomarinimicrobiota bacterium]
MQQSITPVSDPFELSLSVPGDKSISHRSVMFSAFTNGACHISNLGSGADVESTISVMQQLGLDISYEPNEHLAIINSIGIDGLSQPAESLDAGNSGTTLRLMTGLLSGRQFESIITGDHSLQSRPMGRIVNPLNSMGANISAQLRNNAPLQIRPGDLHGIDYEMPVASAQVKSALILAGLQATGETVIREQNLSRRHTEMMLSRFGGPVQVDGKVITVQKLESPLSPYDMKVPGDPSSAAYWAAAAAIFPGSVSEIRDINLSPERIAFLNVLKEMGVEVAIEVKDTSIEPRGNVTVTGGDLTGVTIREEDIPALIDELPLIGVLGAFAEGTTVVRKAKELRYKECDRIAATVANLEMMNVSATEYEDGFEIHGDEKPDGAEMDSFGDHRIAMTFAVAGLGAADVSVLKNADAASVSYPEFWGELRKLQV